MFTIKKILRTLPFGALLLLNPAAASPVMPEGSIDRRQDSLSKHKDEPQVLLKEFEAALTSLKAAQAFSHGDSGVEDSISDAHDNLGALSFKLRNRAYESSELGLSSIKSAYGENSKEIAAGLYKKAIQDFDLSVHQYDEVLKYNNDEEILLERTTANFYRAFSHYQLAIIKGGSEQDALNSFERECLDTLEAYNRFPDLKDDPKIVPHRALANFYLGERYISNLRDSTTDATHHANQVITYFSAAYADFVQAEQLNLPTTMGVLQDIKLKKERCRQYTSPFLDPSKAAKILLASLMISGFAIKAACGNKTKKSEEHIEEEKEQKNLRRHIPGRVIRISPLNGFSIHKESPPEKKIRIRTRLQNALSAKKDVDTVSEPTTVDTKPENTQKDPADVTITLPWGRQARNPISQKKYDSKSCKKRQEQRKTQHLQTVNASVSTDVKAVLTTSKNNTTPKKASSTEAPQIGSKQKELYAKREEVEKAILDKQKEQQALQKALAEKIKELEAIEKLKRTANEEARGKAEEKNKQQTALAKEPEKKPDSKTFALSASQHQVHTAKDPFSPTHKKDSSSSHMISTILRNNPHKEGDYLDVPEDLKPLARKIIGWQKEAKCKFYLVGGGVHDVLDRKFVADIDLVTDIAFEPFSKIAKVDATTGKLKELKDHKKNHKSFSSLPCLRERDGSLRSDHATICHSELLKKGGLLADANDRDLTANAIYLEFCEINGRLQFKIHDPTKQGISDYQEKILRFIGGEETENVESKLKEDPIRLLRLIYKAAKWNTDIPIEYEKIILDLLELEKKKIFASTPKGSLVYWLHKLAKLENAARCKAELKKFKLFTLLPYANDIFECQEKIKLARKNPANEIGLFLAAKSQALGALAEDLRPPHLLTKASPS